MSDDTFFAWQTDENYIPNPFAARILAQFIQYDYLPSPIPDLPPDWILAINAVRGATRRERWRSFMEGTKEMPYAMVTEVQQAFDQTLDRTQNDRVLYTSRDVLADPPQVTWAVQDLFAQPSLNLLVGDPGTKKTYLAIDLAVCAALGKPWLNRATNARTALFIDEETGLYQLWSRLNAVYLAHQAGEDTPFRFTSLAGYNLRDPQDTQELLNRAISIDAGLIVIDALANLVRTGENNLGAVQHVLFHLRRLAESCRAAVVVIHHTNRHGVFRGSSSISAAMDLMLEVSSAPEDSLIEFRPLKARFHAPAPFCARATFQTTPEGKPLFRLEPTNEVPGEHAQSVPADPRQGLTYSILEFLASNSPASRQQITAHLSSHSEGAIRFAIHELLSNQLIVRVNSGSHGVKALYALPAASLSS